MSSCVTFLILIICINFTLIGSIYSLHLLFSTQILAYFLTIISILHTLKIPWNQSTTLLSSNIETVRRTHENFLLYFAQNGKGGRRKLHIVLQLISYRRNWWKWQNFVNSILACFIYTIVWEERNYSTDIAFLYRIFYDSWKARPEDRYGWVRVPSVDKHINQTFEEFSNLKTTSCWFHLCYSCGLSHMQKTKTLG